MKRIFITIFTLLLLFACTEQNNIVSPENHNQETSFVKKTDTNNNSGWEFLDGYTEKSWNKTVRYEQFCDIVTSGNGKNKAQILVYNENKVVEVYSELVFWDYDQYCWRGFTATILIEGRDIDWDCGSDLINGIGNGRYLDFNVVYEDVDLYADFSPTPFKFASPIKLHMTWDKLPQNIFDELQAANEFSFIDNNGDYIEKVNYDALTFDTRNNTMTLSGAEIPHFSRYGFLR